MKYILAGSIIFFVISCKQKNTDPDKQFSEFGVFFEYPVDWAITEEEVFDQGLYLSCEKKGLESSGLITISYLEFYLSESEMMNLIKDEMKENPIYQSTDLDFYYQQDTLFNANNCLRSDYRVHVLGMPHRGSIFCFSACERSFAVLFQEAVEDRDSNKEGFEKVRSSFKCHILPTPDSTDEIQQEQLDTIN